MSMDPDKWIRLSRGKACRWAYSCECVVTPLEDREQVVEEVVKVNHGCDAYLQLR